MKPIKRHSDLKKLARDKKALRQAVMLSMMLHNPYVENTASKDRRAEPFLQRPEGDQAS